MYYTLVITQDIIHCLDRSPVLAPKYASAAKDGCVCVCFCLLPHFLSLNGIDIENSDLHATLDFFLKRHLKKKKLLRLRVYIMHFLPSRPFCTTLSMRIREATLLLLVFHFIFSTLPSMGDNDLI